MHEIFRQALKLPSVYADLVISTISIYRRWFTSPVHFRMGPPAGVTASRRSL